MQLSWRRSNIPVCKCRCGPGPVRHLQRSSLQEGRSSSTSRNLFLLSKSWWPLGAITLLVNRTLISRSQSVFAGRCLALPQDLGTPGLSELLKRPCWSEGRGKWSGTSRFLWSAFPSSSLTSATLWHGDRWAVYPLKLAGILRKTYFRVARSLYKGCILNEPPSSVWRNWKGKASFYRY